MTTRFNSRSTAEEVTAGLDLSGKTVVVTGVNSGLGHETLRVLAQRGAHVIGAARTLEKARAACKSVAGDTTPVACELAEMESVRDCARTINALDAPVDVLICNAGIMAPARLSVKNGLESQFLTNHMGHFLLTYLLQDTLKKAPEGRIVMLSSLAHALAGRRAIDYDNLDGSRGYRPWQFYGQSKLANLLTARAFNERLRGTSVTANAVHPGVIGTNLSRDVGGFSGWLLRNPAVSALSERLLNKSVAEGASTQCFVATHPSLKGVGGRYFADNAEARPVIRGNPRGLADRLWEFSVDYLASYLR
jgi:WW domain-containing oxidoreductase